MTPRQQIIAIDKQIDANHRALILRLRFQPDRCPDAWQRAWDRCPDLWERDQDLFRQRGALQVLRDVADEKAHRIEKIRARRKGVATKKCPTCGCHTLRAA